MVECVGVEIDLVLDDVCLVCSCELVRGKFCELVVVGVVCDDSVCCILGDICEVCEGDGCLLYGLSC